MIIHSVKFERPISNAWLVDPMAQPHQAPVSGVDAEGAGSKCKAEGSPTHPDSEAIEKLLREISGGVNQLHSQTAQQVGDLQALSVRLASMIVTQIVGATETMRIQRLEKLLTEALSRTETPIAAYVHPDDFLKLEEYRSALELDVQPDASVDVGETRVDFVTYDLVSNLQQQLDQIEHRLREVFSHA